LALACTKNRGQSFKRNRKRGYTKKKKKKKKHKKGRMFMECRNFGGSEKTAFFPENWKEGTRKRLSTLSQRFRKK